jgi:hypothetical protein
MSANCPSRICMVALSCGRPYVMPPRGNANRFASFIRSLRESGNLSPNNCGSRVAFNQLCQSGIDCRRSSWLPGSCRTGSHLRYIQLRALLEGRCVNQYPIDLMRSNSGTETKNKSVTSIPEFIFVPVRGLAQRGQQSGATIGSNS